MYKTNVQNPYGGEWNLRHEIEFFLSMPSNAFLIGMMAGCFFTFSAICYGLGQVERTIDISKVCTAVQGVKK